MNRESLPTVHERARLILPRYRENTLQRNAKIMALFIPVIKLNLHISTATRPSESYFQITTVCCSAVL